MRKHDELRQLRKVLPYWKAMHQEGLDRQRNRLKWLAIGSVAGLAGIVLFFGLELRDLSMILESPERAIGRYAGNRKVAWLNSRK